MSDMQLDQAKDRKVSDCVRRCEAKLVGGVRYHEPPQSGTTIFEALPIWREASVRLRGPVAKNFGDGTFFVVSPKTTETELREMYTKGGGDAAFELALQQAAQPKNFPYSAGESGNQKPS